MHGDVDWGTVLAASFILKIPFTQKSKMELSPDFSMRKCLEISVWPNVVEQKLYSLSLTVWVPCDI